MLLKLKQVPVLAHAAQHVIEEVVEVLPKGIPDKYNVISQGNFVLCEVFADLILHNTLSQLNVLQALLNLLLKRCLEVELIN